MGNEKADTNKPEVLEKLAEGRIMTSEAGLFLKLSKLQLGAGNLQIMFNLVGSNIYDYTVYGKPRDKKIANIVQPVFDSIEPSKSYKGLTGKAGFEQLFAQPNIGGR